MRNVGYRNHAIGRMLRQQSILHRAIAIGMAIVSVAGCSTASKKAAPKKPATVSEKSVAEKETAAKPRDAGLPRGVAGARSYVAKLVHTPQIDAAYIKYAAKDPANPKGPFPPEALYVANKKLGWRNSGFLAPVFDMWRFRDELLVYHVPRTGGSFEAELSTTTDGKTFTRITVPDRLQRIESDENGAVALVQPANGLGWELNIRSNDQWTLLAPPPELGKKTVYGMCISKTHVGLMFNETPSFQFVSFARPTSATKLFPKVVTRSLPDPGIVEKCAISENRFAVLQPGWFATTGWSVPIAIAEGEAGQFFTSQIETGGKTNFGEMFLSADENGSFLVVGTPYDQGPTARSQVWRVGSKVSDDVADVEIRASKVNWVATVEKGDSRPEVAGFSNDNASVANAAAIDPSTLLTTTSATPTTLTTAAAVPPLAATPTTLQGTSTVVASQPQVGDPDPTAGGLDVAERRTPVASTLTRIATVEITQASGADPPARWTQMAVAPTSETDSATFEIPRGYRGGVVADDSVSPTQWYVYGSGRPEAGAASVAQIWMLKGNRWVLRPTSVSAGGVVSTYMTAHRTPIGIMFGGSIGSATRPQPLITIINSNGTSRSLKLGAFHGEVTSIATTDDGNVLAAVTLGSSVASIFRTADGVSWEQVQIAAPQTNFTFYADEIVVSKSTIVVGGLKQSMAGETSSYLWVSKDGGKSFGEVRLPGKTSPSIRLSKVGISAMTGTLGPVWESDTGDRFRLNPDEATDLGNLPKSMLSDVAALGIRNEFIQLEWADQEPIPIFAISEDNRSGVFVVGQDQSGAALAIFQNSTNTQIALTTRSTRNPEMIASRGLPPSRRNLSAITSAYAEGSGIEAVAVERRVRDNETREYIESTYDILFRQQGGRWQPSRISGVEWATVMTYGRNILVLSQRTGSMLSATITTDGIRFTPTKVPNDIVSLASDAHGAVVVTDSPNTDAVLLQISDTDPTDTATRRRLRWTDLDTVMKPHLIAGVCTSVDKIGLVSVDGVVTLIDRKTRTASAGNGISSGRVESFVPLDPDAFGVRCGISETEVMVAWTRRTRSGSNFEFSEAKVAVGRHGERELRFLAAPSSDVSHAVAGLLAASDGTFYVSFAVEAEGLRGEASLWRYKDSIFAADVEFETVGWTIGLDIPGSVMEADGRVLVLGESNDRAVIWQRSKN